MAILILGVMGSDRPGLTQALARAVFSAGGNWLESHLSRLGGLYVGDQCWSSLRPTASTPCAPR